MSRPTNHVICPVCYYRNPVTAKTCENCGHELNGSGELQDIFEDVIPDPNPSENEPKPSADNSQSKPPIKDIRSVKREDLDWLSMLDLDADLLTNPPSRPISEENILTTDWINRLVPQSDELPKLPETPSKPETSALPEKPAKPDPEDELAAFLQSVEGDNRPTPPFDESKRSEVFDLLLRDDFDRPYIRDRAEQKPLPDSDFLSTIDEVEAAEDAGEDQDLFDTLHDQESGTSGSKDEYIQSTGDASLDSWLSDVAANYVESAEMAAVEEEDNAENETADSQITTSTETEFDSELDKIPDWLSWEKDDPKESNVIPSVAELSHWETEKVPMDNLFSEDASEEQSNRPEPEKNSNSAPVRLEDLIAQADTTQPIVDIDAISNQQTGPNEMPSDDTLQAWLSDLESRSATADSSESKNVPNTPTEQGVTGFPLDRLPDWMQEEDLFASSEKGTAAEFDDDDLEWIVDVDDFLTEDEPEAEIGTQSPLIEAESKDQSPFESALDLPSLTPSKAVAEKSEDSDIHWIDELPDLDSVPNIDPAPTVSMPEPQEETFSLEEETEEAVAEDPPAIDALEPTTELERPIQDLPIQENLAVSEDPVVSEEDGPPPLSSLLSGLENFQAESGRSSQEIPALDFDRGSENDVDPIESLQELWSNSNLDQPSEETDLVSTIDQDADNLVLNIDDLFFGEFSQTEETSDENEEVELEASTPLTDAVNEVEPDADLLLDLESEEEDIFDFEGEDPFKTPEGALQVDDLNLISLDQPEEIDLSSATDIMPESIAGGEGFDPFNTPVVPQSTEFDFERTDLDEPQLDSPVEQAPSAESDVFADDVQTLDQPLSSRDIDESLDDILEFLDDIEDEEGNDEYTRPSPAINLDAFRPQAPEVWAEPIESIGMDSLEPDPIEPVISEEPEQPIEDPLPFENILGITEPATEPSQKEDDFSELANLFTPEEPADDQDYFPKEDRFAEDEPEFGESWFESLQSKTKAQMRIEEPDDLSDQGDSIFDSESSIMESASFTFDKSAASQSFNDWIDPDVSLPEDLPEEEPAIINRFDDALTEEDLPIPAEIESLDFEEAEESEFTWIDELGDSSEELTGNPFEQSFQLNDPPEIINDIPTTPSMPVEELSDLSFDEWLGEGNASAAQFELSDDDEDEDDLTFIDEFEEIDPVEPEQIPSAAIASAIDEPDPQSDGLMEELEALASLDEAIAQAGEASQPALPDWAKELQSNQEEQSESPAIESEDNPLQGIDDIIDISPVIAKQIDDLSSVQQPRYMRPEVHKIKAKQAAESARAVYSGDPTKPVAVPKARQRYQPRFDPQQYEGMSRFAETSRRRNIRIAIILLVALIVLIIFLFSPLFG